jgi:hypothetical protein
MTKTPIQKARVRVTITWYLRGSVLKQTVDSGCDQVETHLEVESDAPPEKVAQVIRCAKRGCFAEQLVVRPVPLKSTITLNGEDFNIDLGVPEGEG